MTTKHPGLKPFPLLPHQEEIMKLVSETPTVTLHAPHAPLGPHTAADLTVFFGNLPLPPSHKMMILKPRPLSVEVEVEFDFSKIRINLED